MMRLKTAALLLFALAMLVPLAGLTGCESSAPTRAAVDTPPAPIPQIFHQSNGEELLQLDPARVPGATLGEVRKVELPAVLEANGQVTFDDRRVSSIVSRVAGRIEQVRVSQWDNVRRGEQIKFTLRNNGELDHEFVLASTKDNLKYREEMKIPPKWSTTIRTRSG